LLQNTHSPAILAHWTAILSDITLSIMHGPNSKKYVCHQLEKGEQKKNQDRSSEEHSAATRFMSFTLVICSWFAVGSSAKCAKVGFGREQGYRSTITIAAIGIAILPIAGFLLSVLKGRRKDAFDRAGFAVLINNVFDPGQTRGR
jgi:hypothetical protein